jgi:hypothetical protein
MQTFLFAFVADISLRRMNALEVGKVPERTKQKFLSAEKRGDHVEIFCAVWHVCGAAVEQTAALR